MQNRRVGQRLPTRAACKPVTFSSCIAADGCNTYQRYCPTRPLRSTGVSIGMRVTSWRAAPKTPPVMRCGIACRPAVFKSPRITDLGVRCRAEAGQPSGNLVTGNHGLPHHSRTPTPAPASSTQIPPSHIETRHAFESRYRTALASPGRYLRYGDVDLHAPSEAGAAGACVGWCDCPPGHSRGHTTFLSAPRCPHHRLH